MDGEHPRAATCFVWDTTLWQFFNGHSNIGTCLSKMFLGYKLLVFLTCVVIFSTANEEYEHSDKEIVTSDDSKSVLRGLFLVFSGVFCLVVALAIAATTTGLLGLVSHHHIYGHHTGKSTLFYSFS